MAKRPNANIGTVECPICQEVGAIRKDRVGKLYYVCHCGGPHPLHGERGQDFVVSHGQIWGPDGAPADAPEWIAQGLGFPPGTRSPWSRPRSPAPLPPQPEPDRPPGPSANPKSNHEDEDERIRGGLFL